MVDIRQPRRGSLGFRHRKRAEREIQNPAVWKGEGILGFIGYKVGMISCKLTEDKKTVLTPATVVEVPPIMVYGVRFYHGGKSIADYIPQEVKGIHMKPHTDVPEEFDGMRLLAMSDPSKTGIGRKKPFRLEIGYNGEWEKARGLVGQSISVDQVFNPGEYVDVIGVTRGRGWQGEVKRFGISLQRRKSTGKRRHVGTLGPWHPAYVMYTAPRAGQTGYHRRTEWNKRILGFWKPEEINPKSGFRHYGVVRTQAMVVEGSLPGPQKRVLVFRKAVRQPEPQPPKSVEVVI